MWFKQLQVFQLDENFNLSPAQVIENLTPFAFRPCLPSMPMSHGWISPIETDEDAPLVRTMNGNIMICLNVEEKILPATVIRHELDKKIKKIEIAEDRKIRQREKLTLKDELTTTLLTKAFSQFTKLYAYIDTKMKRVILGTANAKKTELFMTLFKKSISESIKPLDINKLSSIFTHWLKHQDYPSAFSIEKSCVLQDPSQQSRVVRCQQQDLFATSIQALINDGCEVKQLAMNWQHRIGFVLSSDFLLKSIKYQDEVITQANEMEPETKEQEFDADFLIMSDVLSQILEDLITVFEKDVMQKKKISHVEQNVA